MQNLSASPEHCRRIRVREAAGLHLTDSEYFPGVRMPRHAHAPASFGVVLRGEFRERVGHADRLVRPGAIVFRPPNEEHAVAFGASPVRIFRVELDASWKDRLASCSRVLRAQSEIKSAALLGLATRLHGELWSSDSAANLAMEGLTLEILAAGARDSEVKGFRRGPAWLDRAEEYLRESFKEGRALDELASVVGVDAAHLCRVFRQRHGCTIGEFVRRLRIGHAARLLGRPEERLAEIALECGFADQSHFTRTFRRIMGTTPKEYRRSLFRSVPFQIAIPVQDRSGASV